MGIKEELLQKIQDKTLIMGVCGLGYVGLPLAVDKAKHGFKTIGFDVQQEKVNLVNAGKNYIGDVVNADLEELTRWNSFNSIDQEEWTSASRPIRSCPQSPKN